MASEQKYFKIPIIPVSLDAKVWGPKYWFVLHTIAINYPLHPNETSKKKYYDFISNFSLLIPVSNIANHFSELLDAYPVTPYLDSRESMIKWFHFIHNKVNVSLNIPEKSLEEALHEYYKLYEPIETQIQNDLIKREKYFYIGFITLLLMLAFYAHKKG